MARTDRTATKYETLNYIQTPGIQTSWNNLKQTPRSGKKPYPCQMSKTKPTLCRTKLKVHFEEDNCTTFQY